MFKAAEAREAASEVRHEMITNQLRSEFQQLRADIRADMTEMRADISYIKGKQEEYDRRHSMFMNYVGILVTACGVLIACVQLYLAFKGGL